MLKDLQAFQQQITAQTQAATQLLGSQQAEIKRLSEQMTALAAKLDTLQRSVTSVQVAPPAPVPKPIMPPVRKKTSSPQAGRGNSSWSAAASAASIKPLTFSTDTLCCTIR